MFAEFPKVDGFCRIASKRVPNYFREIADFEGPRGTGGFPEMPADTVQLCILLLFAHIRYYFILE